MGGTLFSLTATCAKDRAGLTDLDTYAESQQPEPGLCPRFPYLTMGPGLLHLTWGCFSSTLVHVECVLTHMCATNMTHPGVNGACTLTLVHTSTPVLPAPWFLGSRCQTVHAYTPTKCPVAACLWAIPATKLCLYHLGPSVYTCVTCPQSLEAP